MIQLKLKSRPSPDQGAPAPAPAVPPVSPSFGPQTSPLIKPHMSLQPYIDKVIDNLRQTDVTKELVLPIEEAIRRKTYLDTTKLSLDSESDAYRKVYLANARHIISNLKSNNEIANKDLIAKINQGQITPDQMVKMVPHEMLPERWQPLIEKKRSDNDKLTKDPEATTTLFWCSRCGRNKCVYVERQDRCSDEPRTVHITCCYCGRRWKQ